MLLNTASAVSFFFFPSNVIPYSTTAEMMPGVQLIPAQTQRIIPAGLAAKRDTCTQYNKTLSSTYCFHNGPLEETLTDCLLSRWEVLTVLTIILLSTGWAIPLEVSNDHLFCFPLSGCSGQSINEPLWRCRTLTRNQKGKLSINLQGPNHLSHTLSSVSCKI